jgi:hypothetical protein
MRRMAPPACWKTSYGQKPPNKKPLRLKRWFARSAAQSCSTEATGSGTCKPKADRKWCSNGVTRSVPPVERAFFPLDEQLALLPGGLMPFMHACLVRLAVWMPFEKAAQFMEEMLDVTVSKALATRFTEAAGAAYWSYPVSVDSIPLGEPVCRICALSNWIGET